MEVRVLRLRSLKRDQGGFTLLETMVVLIIISLALAIVVPSMTSGMGRLGLKITAKNIATTLKYARNQALREREVYYVEALEDRLSIRALSSKEAKKELSLEEGVEVTADPEEVMVFYPGGRSSGGTLKVMNMDNEDYYTVRVARSTGRVSVSQLSSELSSHLSR